MTSKLQIDQSKYINLMDLANQNFWAARFFFTQSTNDIYKYLAQQNSFDSNSLKEKMAFPASNATDYLMHFSVELFMKAQTYNEKGNFKTVHILEDLYNDLPNSMQQRLENGFSQIIKQQEFDLKLVNITNVKDAIDLFSKKQIPLKYGQISAEESLVLYCLGLACRDSFT